MNTCQTCKWWTLTDTREPTMGRCDSAKVTDKWPEYDQVLESHDDDLSGKSHLVTGPDFGCVHHELNL